MRRLMLPAVLVLVLSGCATVHAQYTSFGEADPARDTAVINAYEQDAQGRRDRAEDPRASLLYAKLHPEEAQKLASVHVLVDTVPEGIKLQDGSLSVAKGAPYQLLGKMVMLRNHGLTFTHEELIEEAKHLAVAAGGNLVLLSYADAPQNGKAYGAAGYVLKADQGKLDTTTTTSAQLPKPTQL